MRIAFLGTPEFAVPVLDALAERHDVAAVYCQPPRPAGRGKALLPSPIQRRAEALGLPVRAPVSLKDVEEQAAFAALGLDVAVVAAYGLILPQAILMAPKRGCLNVHASLLPRWRGAAPIQRAILAGDRITGVTIMQMERGLDTGAMLAKRETAVDGKTAGALTAELAAIGAALIAEVLASPDDYAPVLQPEEGATYAAKIAKAEARLDFTAPAATVERQIRAFNPAPGAWFEYAGERIRIHAAELVEARHAPGEVLDDLLTIGCGAGALRPTAVQRAGRGILSAQELLRGFPIPAGTRLA